MISASDSSRTRAQMRAGLWSWTAGLVLCIISYPAVLLARVAPRAGLVGGLAAGAVLAASAGLGYAGRRGLDQPRRAALVSLAVAIAVGLTAIFADGEAVSTAAILAAMAAAEIVFVWFLFPAVATEAEAAEGRSRSTLRLLPPGARRGNGLRPALSLALLLGFVMLGLGAIWRRGEAWVPSPAGWLVALALLSLGLMFVARMSFFERSAREGNLVMPPGSFRRWVEAGLVLLAVAALLALAAPRKAAPERVRPAPVGSAAAARPSPAAAATPASGRAAARRALAAAQQAAAARAARHRRAMLSLLLLLLLAALVLIWGFSRTRAARWLLAIVAAALSRLLARGRRLLALLRGWFSPPAVEAPGALAPEAPEMADPLFDVFEHPELLRRLSPAEVLIRAYHLLLNYAEMLGHGRLAGQTPFEYVQALDRAAPQARDALRALTWGYAGAMYGQKDAPLLNPTATKLAWGQIAEALKGEMTPDDLDLRRRAYLAARRLEQRA